jgi:hypothetical protein
MIRRVPTQGLRAFQPGKTLLLVKRKAEEKTITSPSVDNTDPTRRLDGAGKV